MRNLFLMGGPGFMAILTLCLIITTAWFIYHFVISYNLKELDREKLLRMFAYGKSMGLFALVIGIIGQMNGLYAMFTEIENTIKGGQEVIPALVFEGIKVTMIVTVYGMIIYLFSLALWFLSGFIIERRFKP
jgi:hypothetical protein